MAASKELKAALLVTIAVCQAQWSVAVTALALADLAEYSDEQIVAALKRCRTECKFKLTLADIIERIDDGRPSADEAWGQVGTRDEMRTIVSTDEAMEAFGEVMHLLGSDETGARMAFRSAYQRIVQRNKQAAKTLSWTYSPGHDAGQREGALRDAVARGRLDADHVAGLLGEPTKAQKELAESNRETLEAERTQRMSDLTAILNGSISPERKAEIERDWEAAERDA